MTARAPWPPRRCFFYKLVTRESTVDS